MRKDLACRSERLSLLHVERIDDEVFLSLDLSRLNAHWASLTMPECCCPGVEKLDDGWEEARVVFECSAAGIPDARQDWQ